MSELKPIFADSDTPTSDYIEDGKNKQIIKCRYCGSKILDKKAVTLVKQEVELPLMQQDSRTGATIEKETLQHFWHVDNMYTFENIGFTHTVANLKYLSCADCDAGPVGYHDLNTKESYVALLRVTHV